MPSVHLPSPDDLPKDGDLFARGDLLENLEGIGELMPSTIEMAPSEGVQVARAAIFLPIKGEGFSRSDIARDGKDKGEGAVTARPVTVKFGQGMPSTRSLAVVGQVADADVVGNSIHGIASLII